MAAGRESHAYKQGAVLIEELEQEPGTSKAAAAPSRAGGFASAQVAAAQAAAAVAAEQEAAALAYQQQQQAAAEEEEEEEEEEEVADLQDVYDSSASLAAEQRRARAEWLALPMDEKLR